MTNAVHVQPRAQNDWVVTQDGGRELGHCPTKVEAEAVGYKIARKRKVELLVHNGSGTVERRSRPRKSWLSRLFGG
jgi:uncharacterized protein DUF2188